MKTSPAKRQPEPQEPKSPPVPLESLEDIAWELWLLVELLAPVRRRLPNTAPQKLVDYIKDRLIANSVALAKWTPLKTTGNSRGDGRLRDWGMRGIGNGGTTGIFRRG